MKFNLRKGAVALIVTVLAVLPFIVNAQPGPDDTTLVIAQTVDTDGWEPSEVNSRAEANIFGHLFASLYQITETGEIVPYLANDVRLENEGTQLVFTLNEGLTCHDGEALTAEDVAFTFNRAADDENAFTGNTAGFVFDSIEFIDAEVISELEVAINVGRFQSINLGLISEVYIHCMDSYSAMTLEEAAAMPIGSGPYEFVEWVPDSHTTLQAVEGFDLRPQGFETLVWRVIPENSTRAAELIAGNVDIIANLVPDQQDAVANSGTAEVAGVQGTRRMYVGYNMTGLFAGDEGGDAIMNTDVRVAMQYAVDVPTICATLLGIECERASSMVNPPNNNPN
ncbi:MAG: ABC transporter substrate-binding protein, partial [Chloroflexota bacterium]